MIVLTEQRRFGGTLADLDAVRVAESGILVGEALVRDGDPRAAVGRLSSVAG